VLGGTPSAPSDNNRVYIGETEDFWPVQWPFALEGEKQGGSSPPGPSSGLDALGQSVALKWHVFTLACQHVRVPKIQAAVRWPGIGAGNGNRPFEQEAICKSASTLLRLAAIPCFTPMLSFRNAVSHRVLALATAGIRFRNRVLRVLASRCLCDAVSPWERTNRQVSTHGTRVENLCRLVAARLKNQCLWQANATISAGTRRALGLGVRIPRINERIAHRVREVVMKNIAAVLAVSSTLSLVTMACATVAPQSPLADVNNMPTASFQGTYTGHANPPPELPVSGSFRGTYSSNPTPTPQLPVKTLWDEDGED
jgi:hypothetical protein